MKNAKALLNIGDSIVDITKSIQTVGAYDGDTLRYRGCGIEYFRSNHIHGNAIIFLCYVGQSMIFGEWVDIYALSPKWKHWDYSMYTMKALDGKPPLICGHDAALRGECIIY